MSQPTHALTLTSNAGILRIIACEFGICSAFDPNTTPIDQRPPFEKFTAIWDTGASGTVITQYVIDRCGLKATGMTRNHTAAGTVDAETFLVNVELINGVKFANLRVIRGDLPPGAHALIGMDIITAGDFSITNVNGKTILSFRTPSQRAVDFVQEINKQKAAAAFKPAPPRHKKRR